MVAYALIGCLYQSLIILEPVRIKTITYQKVKNLGNYESERLEMSAQVDEDDEPFLVASELRLMVNQLLDEPVAKDSEEESESGF